MSSLARWMRLAALAGIGVWLLPAAAGMQPQRGPMWISADSIAELRSFGLLVDGMIQSRELEPRVTYADRADPANSHEGLSQYYRGVPVWGGDVTLFRRRGVVASIVGTLHAGISLATTPTLSPDEARQAIERAASSAIAEFAPALVVLPMPVGDYRLAYQATTRSMQTLFVDAHDGGVLLRYSTLRTQTSDCRPGESSCDVGVGTGVLGDQKKLSVTRSGSSFLARDTLRPADILTLDLRGDPARARTLLGDNGVAPGFATTDVARSADNTWRDSAVVDAHVHMGWDYDYLFTRHDYDGIDDNDLRLFGLVNPPAAIVGENAFWAPPPAGPEAQGVMVFGASRQGQPFTAIEIVGHEIMHGVTSHRALGDLARVNFFGGASAIPCPGAPFVCDQGQLVLVLNAAGAINEAFADIFGTSLEFFVGDATTPDYTIGEDLAGIGAIRALDDPGTLSCSTFDPATLLTVVACPDHITRAALYPLVTTNQGLAFFPVGQTDNGAEHDNSTIISHAFYLAVEGGTNRTSGLTVQGVGGANRGQIERAFFDALIDRLPTSPSFAQVAQAVIDAARARFGAGSAPVTAVAQAFAAVGLPTQ